MQNNSQKPQPTPFRFFQTANAYQQSAIIRTALELDIFSAIAEGNLRAADIAKRCSASERGVRILCDTLVIHEFLTKAGDQYGLTEESAVFLVRKSPAYLGGTLEFLHARDMIDAFDRLTEAVRKGGTAMLGKGNVTDDNPVWIKFARAMGTLTAMPAKVMAQLADPKADRGMKVLDIAAGHGTFGITFASHNPKTEVVALDWPAVLEVAKENAERAGVASRYKTLTGSAFDLDFGTDYDVVLLTNFLHHFDVPTCETLLRKIHAALKPDGMLLTLEFVPNDDRISPPMAAHFSIMMLASTPSGDAYTFAQLDSMLRNSGFKNNEMHPIPPAVQMLLVSRKT